MSELRDILLSGQVNDIKLVNTDSNSSVATKQYVIDAVADVTDEVIDSRGLLALNLAVSTTTALTTSFATVEFVDTIEADYSNQHIEYDAVNFRFKLKSVGVYQFIAFGAAEFPNGNEVTFAYSINGTELRPDAMPVFIGNGNKPIRVSDINTLTITQAMLDDTANSNAGEAWVEIKAKADASISLTLSSAHVNIEKKY